MYSINVLVVSYNQEKVIGRALDSVLRQKQFGLNKIIISDDGSKDGTLEIIEKYKKEFPDIIELYTNPKNLGRERMYDNFVKVVSKRGKADLYCRLAGDDAYCDGWFKAIQDYIIDNKIDVRNKAITIFSNWKSINPDGIEKIYRGNYLAGKSDLNLISLKLRSLIFNRALISSAKVYEGFTPIILDEGLCVAEDMFDLQTEIHTEYGYYCDYVGSIYYTGYGVSKDILGSRDYYKKRMDSCKRVKSLFDFGYNDLMYWDYMSSIYNCYYEPNVRALLNLIKTYWKSFEFKYNRYSLKQDLLFNLSCTKRILKKILKVT